MASVVSGSSRHLRRRARDCLFSDERDGQKLCGGDVSGSGGPDGMRGFGVVGFFPKVYSAVRSRMR